MCNLELREVAVAVCESHNYDRCAVAIQRITHVSIYAVQL